MQANSTAVCRLNQLEHAGMRGGWWPAQAAPHPPVGGLAGGQLAITNSAGDASEEC